MAKSDTQSVTSSRSRLSARVREHYPDRQFAAREGVDGAVGDFGDDEAQAVLDYLDEQDTSIKEGAENSKRLLDLFNTDPVSAQFVNDWAKTGNVAEALVGIFGSDAVRKAMESKEGQEALAKRNQDYLARMAEEDGIRKEMESNYAKSFDDLDKFGEENGLSDEQKDAIFSRLNEISDRAIKGKYDVADFRMVLNDLNHDSDVSGAREEGVIQGRNEKMDEQRQRSRSRAAVPQSLQGQPGIPAARQERKPRSVFDEARDAM